MGLILWIVTWMILILTHVATGNEGSTSTKSMGLPSYDCDCEPPTPPSDGCLGAVYFPTNNKLGNWVIVNCIQSNGTLIFNNTISTHGNGSSKFAQFIFVDNIITGDNFLFVVNSGSDSVSMFTIDPQSPEKLTFVTSVNSQGNYPACLAYSSKLKVLCVLNAGLINNVACFKVTPTDLTPLPNTIKPVGESAVNPPSVLSVSDIIFTANSNQLIVSVQGRLFGSPIPGSIVVFPVLSEGTVLGDPVINNVTNFFPQQLNLVPITIANCNNSQQNMVYSAFTDKDSHTIGLFVVPPSGVINTTSIVVIPIPGSSSPGWSKFSPRTGLLYTSDLNRILLTETRIECLDDGRLNGTMVKQYGLSTSTTDLVIVSLPTGDYLYTLVKLKDNLNTIIQVMSLGSTPGNVTHIQNFTPDNATIVAQTGQQLKDFREGIAAFIAEPQSGGCKGQCYPRPVVSSNPYPPLVVSANQPSPNYQPIPYYPYRRYRYPWFSNAIPFPRLYQRHPIRM